MFRWAMPFRCFSGFLPTTGLIALVFLGSHLGRESALAGQLASSSDFFTNGPLCDRLGYGQGALLPAVAGEDEGVEYLLTSRAVYTRRQTSHPWVNEIESVAVYWVAPDQDLPERALALGSVAGLTMPLFRTDDFGETWMLVNENFFTGSVRRFIASPEGNGVYYLHTSHRLYRTEDSGANWTSITVPSDPFFGTEPVVLAPSDPSRFYVSTGQNIYRSDDRGQNWTEIEGLDKLGLIGPFATKLAVDPTNADIAYTVIARRLYKTTGDFQWQQIGGEVLSRENLATTLLALPSSPSTLLVGRASQASPSTGGVSRSLDGGLSWEAFEVDGEDVTGLSAGRRPGEVIASTRRGPYRSLDRGETWSPIGRGIAQARTTALAVAPTDPSVIYAAVSSCGARVVRADGGGARWSAPVLLSNVFGDRVGPLLVDAVDPDRVLAGYIDSVFISEDGGASWSQHPFDDGIFGERLASFTRHPENANIIFAAGRERGLSRSLDGGETWSPFPSPMPTVYQLLIHPDNPDDLLVLAEDEQFFQLRDVYQSLDGGQTWSLFDNPAQSGLLERLYRHPSQPDILFFLDEDGLYRTIDDGLTWTSVANWFVGRSSLAFDPTRPSSVYLTIGGVLWRSSDLGTTWEQWENTPTVWQQTEIVVESASDGRLYVDSYTDGIFALREILQDGFESGTFANWSLAIP